MDVEVALREIERQAGTLLDTEAVRICAALFRGNRICVDVAALQG